MDISKKIKDFFNRIFRGKEQKLLEEGKEVENTRDNSSDNSFKDSIREYKTAEWKEPTYESNPIIIYDGMDLSFVPLLDKPPIMTEENFDFDGANRYTLKNKEYDLIRRIADMTVNKIGMELMDTPMIGEYASKGFEQTIKFDLSKRHHEKNEDEIAINMLNDIIKNAVSVREKALEMENRQHENKDREK